MRTRDWYSLAATVVFLGLCILFSGGVYQTVAVGDISLARINRFTGDTWIVVRGVAVKVRYGDLKEALAEHPTGVSIVDEALGSSPVKGRGYRLAPDDIQLDDKVMTWEDILKDPEFQSLGAPEKEKVLRGYFSEHVDADPEFQQKVRSDPSVRDEVWRNMWRTLKEPVPKP